jgi:hypothetical protein
LREIWIHYEGHRSLKSGLREFFQKGIGDSARIKFIPGADRPLRDFFKGLRSDPDVHHILLMDADTLFEQFGSGLPTELVKKRGDWRNDAQVTDDQLHFMVQLMEAWFLVDKSVLVDFYGSSGFLIDSLPKRKNSEDISKSEIVASLKRATENTSKGKYHKTAHAPILLANLNPKLLTKQTAPHAKRLFDTLTQKLKDNS